MQFTVFLASILASATPIDFDTEVLPILTRAGCNAGACHGASTGRGGFKLSLFGGDPAADHRAISCDMEGRRVNLVKPARSLILAKPSGHLDHEGGVRLENDADLAVLTRWIVEGARREPKRSLRQLHVDPNDIHVRGTGELVQLRVTAEFSDKSQRDVTALAVFSPDDPAAVAVDGAGRLNVMRRGRSTVAVRFLTELQAVQVTVPLHDEPLAPASAVDGGWLDGEIQQVLEALRIPAAPPADTDSMLRRLRLDLTGRLPATDEQERFRSAARETAYESLVDRLLPSDDFLDYWTYRIGRWLQLPAYALRDRDGALVYRDWLRGKLARDSGWDEIARELILATGDSRQIGPANFHRQASDARGSAELLATTLLGIELRCANCHNHPLDRWTQDDYHGLAAILASIERGSVVSLNPRGEVAHPITGAAALPRLPGTRYLPAGHDSRDELATWITSPENVFLGRAFVNRVWKELLGRGLVEPVDAIRVTNPGTHPELLDHLAREFVAEGFRLRPLIRRIVMSATYRRSSQATGLNEPDDRFYSRAMMRPLLPEVYVDAVMDVTGSRWDGSENAPPRRAIETVDAFARFKDVAVVSGCTAAVRCVDESIGADLATRLQLINGTFLNAKITDPLGRLASLIARGATDENIVAEFYQRALSRRPAPHELQFWIQQLGGVEAGRVDRLQDFCWSLLSSREFTTNH